MTIQKTAVLGSGVMGGAIAALMANANIPVLLLDIVPKDAKDRNMLTKGAVERMLKTNPSPFTHPDKAKLITCGNIEDDLDKLSDVDWIVEAVKEDLAVKQNVYKAIDPKRKKGSIVSSNTSTIPLHTLLDGLSPQFQSDFMITHFFNPPRFMRLLEMVPGPKTSPERYKEMTEFADVRLGKGIVHCKDTPGFIANRIGVYWLMVALLEAIRLKVPVELADAVMGRPAGIPKTGVFGLFDLIGIDLMPLIAKELLHSLPESDPFRKIYEEPDLVKKMIADGYTGRKGKGGFYRINKEGGKKLKEVINLQTGEYAPEKKSDIGKVSLADLLKQKDLAGDYARSVFGKTFAYTAMLIPEISDEILSVDNAMKWGYSWKSGPFEMMEKVGVDAIAALLKSENLAVPPILEKAAGKKLYKTEDAKRQYFTLKGDYAIITPLPGAWSLADIKLTKKPIIKNGSASLWDVGDGIACFEFTSKMNSIDPDILTLMEQSLEVVKKDYKGLIIGGDADNFSVGANLGFILYAANMAAWPMISDVIKQGQRTMMAMKYAHFPVVGALGGMALGGGCETILHCDAVQAHVESYPGLVEVGVGVIPGWGGCKEMLLRHLQANAKGESRGGVMSALSSMIVGNAMPAISKVFETIGMAKVGGSAEEAKDLKILNEKSRITMNRARLLHDAKQLCLELAKDYQPPQPATISLPGGTAKVAMMMAVKGLRTAGKATPHDETVSKYLAEVLSGGDTDSSETLTEQQILDLEHAAFMELIKTKPTLARIEYMLENNKPLRN